MSKVIKASVSSMLKQRQSKKRGSGGRQSHAAAAAAAAEEEDDEYSKLKHHQDSNTETPTVEFTGDGSPLEEDRVEDIHYFGYGPIVNDMVRHRRNISTKNVQAAYLYDYRLTFHFGGNASVVQQRGYEVHGLLMTLESRDDWKRLLEFDSGNTPVLQQVVPYDDPDHPVLAYMFEIPIPEDIALLDKPIEEALPQERYLKLISQGMRKYGVDDEYIDHTIMAVPFIPTRTPEQYITLPKVKDPLPTWSWSRYMKKSKSQDTTFFVLGDGVFELQDFQQDNPLAKWFHFHGHGKDDCTLAVHKTVVDPNIPAVDTADEITPLHIRWAEDHCVEVVKQYGMTACKVAILKRDTKQKEESAKTSGKRFLPFRKNKK